MLLTPHAHAAKPRIFSVLDSAVVLGLSLSLDWRFCELSLTVSVKIGHYLQDKEPHKPLV